MYKNISFKDMPYHLGCYETLAGNNEKEVTSHVECLIHCKVMKFIYLMKKYFCLSLWLKQVFT